MNITVNLNWRADFETINERFKAVTATLEALQSDTDRTHRNNTMLLAANQMIFMQNNIHTTLTDFHLRADVYRKQMELTLDEMNFELGQLHNALIKAQLQLADLMVDSLREAEEGGEA